MEKNTAILSLERYDQLQKLEEEIKNGKKLYITKSNWFGSSSTSYEYYTDDEMVEKLNEELEKCRKDLSELEKCRKDLSESEQKHSFEENLKNMSWLEIFKIKIK